MTSTTNELTSPRIEALRRSVDSGAVGAVEEFWREVVECGTPLVEPLPDDVKDMLVTFVWRGSEATRNVVVVGAIATPGIPAESQFACLAGTDVWHRTYRLPA